MPSANENTFAPGGLATSRILALICVIVAFGPAAGLVGHARILADQGWEARLPATVWESRTVDEGRARLRSAQIGWITTVNHAGQAQSSPVWFVWDGEAIHVATRPASPKVRNVAANPRVAFHVDGAAPGDVVVSIEGRAEVRDQLDVSDAYVAKYAAGMDRIGVTPGDYFADFSGALRIALFRWRVFVSG